MKRACSLTVAIIAIGFFNCMPYVGKGRGGRTVRVAVECGVDEVRVSGIHGNRQYVDHRITTAGNFPVHFEAKDGKVAVNGRDYRGSVEVRTVDGNLWVINILDLESYLKGVVPCEIGGISEKQIEAAKAQAVAARTYATAHIGQYSDLGFDLYATVQDQVYKGISRERTLTSKAVESTAGEVLFFSNKPIEAKYHSTCGGRTADFNDAWSGPSPPYLRSVVCRYCKNSPHYEWKKVMTKEDFLTVGCNNILTLGLGLILLIYVAVVLSTSFLSDQVAFIGLVIIGVVY